VGIKEIIEQVKPAVVYIICIVTGKIKFPKPDREGQPTSTYVSQNIRVGGAGSGFVVDPDGYIATNGHVLFSFTHANVQDDLYVRQLLFGKATEEQGVPLEYLLEHGKVDTATRHIFVQFGESISGFDIPRKAFPGRIVGLPSPASEKDIAVIKIDRADLASLELGESRATSVGDRVFVIGYPGVVMDHPYLSEETGLEPTVTAGIVSAKRKTKDGSPCLQTDADITHGNSGGPVINEKGEVIGVATFGSMGKEGEIHGYNFLRPSELVEEFLEETGVRNVKLLRRIDESLKHLNDIKLLIPIINDHGKFKIDNCEHSVNGYCQWWRWERLPKWGEFKKDEKIYRIKASPEYCAFCDGFKKKGETTPEEKIDALIRFLVANGSWKMENCVNNKEGFCTTWFWSTEPKFFNLDGNRIKTRKNPEGNYNIEANFMYCAICPSYSTSKST
jgi:hypothetical protein